MTSAYLISSGVILLTVVGIAYGGTFLLRVVDRKVPANELQRSYFRAGHAHAGLLVILGSWSACCLTTRAPRGRCPTGLR